MINISPVRSDYNTKRSQTKANPHFGNKYNIDRYLYHATNDWRYKKILESGMIKPTLDDCGKKLCGVFLINLQNFFLKWKNIFNNVDLRYILFQRIARGDDKLVLIRIPIDKLDMDLLRFRDQNKFLKSRLARNFSELKPDAHEMIGAPVNTEAEKMAREKDPIEYVYTAPIPTGIVEFAGEADFRNIKIVAQQQLTLTKKLKKVPLKDLYDKTIEITLNTLFENQPELDAIKQLRTMEK